MKDILTDANFPRTADQRVYHLGLRPGEVANRIITVGSPSRARGIAAHLDHNPKPYKNVPISIISIGMGFPNMDFFIREVRECLSGDMCVVRLGSCGALADVPVGTVVVPKASVAVSRNVDFNFLNPAESNEPPYRITKPVPADATLHLQVHNALKAAKPDTSSAPILGGIVNASADSFYSSQGRQTSFPDRNQDLIEILQASTPDLATLEMETFHLYHLAACWGGGRVTAKAGEPPLTAGPVQPTTSVAPSPVIPPTTPPLAGHETAIRAAAAQMVFASRRSQEFITPDQVSELERWTGVAVLNALRGMEIPANRLHPEKASVWETMSENVE